MIFPFAVGCRKSMWTFNVAATDGCSSLRDSNVTVLGRWDKLGDLKHNYYNVWKPSSKCRTKVDRRSVPCITLKRILTHWLDTWFSEPRKAGSKWTQPQGVEIEYMKVDAQGFDFDVVKSAGSSLRKIKKFKVELQGEGVTYYSGSTPCHDVVRYFERWGYSWEPNIAKCAEARERDFTFTRIGNWISVTQAGPERLEA